MDGDGRKGGLKEYREGSDHVVKTKTVQTHRIVYQVERGSGCVVGSLRKGSQPDDPDSPRSLHTTSPPASPARHAAAADADENSPVRATALPADFAPGPAPLEEPFPELKLFIDDDVVTPEEPLPLIDPNRRPPANPFSRLIRP